MKGEAEYKVRGEGKRWSEVGESQNVSAPEAWRRAKSYAESAGMPWPVTPKTPSRQLESDAYHLREKTGGSWNVIGRELGVSHCGASKAAHRYATANDLPWPLPTEDEWCREEIGEVAFRLWTRTRNDWEEVGKHLGVSASTAHTSARNHAKKEGLRLPPRMTQGERYYRLYRRGHSWEQIQKKYQIKHTHHVTENAHKWAKKTGAAWPPILASRGQRAYMERVLTGAPWNYIAHVIGVDPEYKSGYHAAKVARTFAEDEGLPWPVGSEQPDPDGGTAYFYRGAGLTWRVVGTLMGISAKSAIDRASTFAKRQKLPWPLAPRFRWSDLPDS